MRSIFVLVASCLFLLSQNVNALSPISAEELYRKSNLYSYRLNPQGDFYIKHYFRNTGYDVLELHSVKTGRFRDAFRLKVRSSGYIENYFWVDNNTLYARYHLGKNKFKDSFINIDLEKLNTTEEEIASIHKINFDGMIIDPLLAKDDRVLVQYEDQNNIRVAEVTHSELLKGKLISKPTFTNYLEDALFYLTGGDGKVKFSFTVDEDEAKFWYFEQKSARWNVLFTLEDLLLDFTPVDLISDTEIAVITNKNTDKKALVAYDFKKKEFGEILYQHDKYDLVSASISKELDPQSKKRRIESVSYREFGRLVTEYYSSKNKELSTVVEKTRPGQQFVTLSEVRQSNNKILLLFSGSNPGEFYLYDDQKKKIKKLGERFPNLMKQKLATSKVFSLKNELGQSIEAIFTKPNESNGVLIVSPHGGPIGVRDTDTFNPFNQYFASRGYSILNVNFRGSEGFGKKFLDKGVGQFGKDIEADISLAVNHILSINKFNKICAIGASYGAYSAFMLNISKPQQYDCAIGAFGVYDLPLLFNSSNYVQTEEEKLSTENVVGKYDSSLRDYSPVYLAEKLKNPVLLIAGTKDDIAHIEHSNRMKYRLTQLNKDFEHVFYEGVGHQGHDEWKWDWHELALMDDFLRRKLDLPYSQSIAQKPFYRKELMRLADAYNFDDIVPNHTDKAFNYYQKAAALGEPRATNNVGAFYEDGVEVKKDINAAISYYRKASKLDFNDAYFNLGRVYSSEKLGKVDLKEAVKQFKLAYEKGVIKARNELIILTCLNNKESFDADYCIKMLESYKADEIKSVYAQLYPLVFDENVTEKINSWAVKFYRKNGYELDVNTNNFEVEEEGLYSRSRRS